MRQVQLLQHRGGPQRGGQAREAVEGQVEPAQVLRGDAWGVWGLGRGGMGTGGLWRTGEGLWHGR